MSYARYCQDQAADCARRVRLARSSPEIAAYYQRLSLRWLRIAEQAQGTGGALGNDGAEAPHSSDLDTPHNTRAHSNGTTACHQDTFA